MKYRTDLTADYVRSLLNYDPETGELRWRVDRMFGFRPGPKAGDLAGGVGSRDGYVFVGIDGKVYVAQRLVWLIVTGAWPEGEVDHEDTDRTNNRWTNLRDISKALNAQNVRRARKDSGSGVQGVWPSPKGCKLPWASSVRFNKRLHFVGTFATKDEAHQAYVKKKRELHAACTL